jgi:hypothetical protein
MIEENENNAGRNAWLQTTTPMPKPHFPAHNQSLGIRVVKSVQCAAQCITPYINHRRVYFVMMDCTSNFIHQRLTVKCLLSAYALYTHRYPQAENPPHILALSVFSDTQIQC